MDRGVVGCELCRCRHRAGRRHRDRFRLHQRLPRHGERDGDLDRHRALPPKVAVGLAALLNFVGAFISLKVAATIAKDIVDPDAITPAIILAGLLGGIFWTLLTWWRGIPSSSS